MNKPLKPILLVGNHVSKETADALRDSGQFDVITSSIGKFPSGGLFVELYRGEEPLSEENCKRLKGARAYVLQSAPESNNDHLQHLMLMAHTLKFYGVSKVTAIAPFLPNLRQDRSMKGRFTSVAADLNAKQLKASGVDAVITVTPHSKGAMGLYEAVFGQDFMPINTTLVFAADIRKRFTVAPDEIAVGAPDGADKPNDEGQARARELTTALFDMPVAFNAAMFRISKVHTGVSDTKITSFDGDVAGKDCIIVDDMIDGGSTMLNAASMLKQHGARSVTIYASHALLTGNALENLLSSKSDGMTSTIDKIVFTDTLPESRDKLQALLAQHPKFAGRVDILSVGSAVAQKVVALEATALNPFQELLRRPKGAANNP